MRLRHIWWVTMAVCAVGIAWQLLGGAVARADSAGTLTRGPYLGNQTATTVQVIWNTNIVTDGVVRYGPDLPYDYEAASSILSTTHVVSLTNLQPGLLYWYGIFSSGIVTPLATASFHTNPMSNAPFMFAALGDSGVGTSNQYAVAALLQRIQPSFVLHTGDVIYSNGEYGNFDPHYFVPYSRTLPSVPFFTAMGNHDHGTLNGQPYLDNFYLPSNNGLGTERYYSFDYGDAHFVALDSGAAGSVDSAQRAWLANDLATTTKFWKFVYFHHAFYSSGPHGMVDAYVAPLRDSLAPLFEQYNVDMVFNGHDHDYERTTARRDYVPTSRGVIYIVTGGGGAGLYVVGSHSWTAFATSAYWHAVKVDISGCRLALQAIAPAPPNDHVFDTLTLDRCAVLFLPTVFDGVGLIE